MTEHEKVYRLKGRREREKEILHNIVHRWTSGSKSGQLSQQLPIMSSVGPRNHYLDWGNLEVVLSLTRVRVWNSQFAYFAYKCDSKCCVNSLTCTKASYIGAICSTERSFICKGYKSRKWVIWKRRGIKSKCLMVSSAQIHMETKWRVNWVRHTSGKSLFFACFLPVTGIANEPEQEKDRPKV